MKYLYQAGKPTGKKFILLHGTGGDETSLIDLARLLDADSTILSLRGQVKEDGMNRFFRRNGLNQFDFVSLEKETDQLLKEITRISAEKDIDLAEWILVGYSNGANIAAHLLLERQTSLTQGIFFHPMSLGVHTKVFDLSDKKVWASYGGRRDQIVSETSFKDLADAFDKRGAALTIADTNGGHQLLMEEVQSAEAWLKE
ncbi:alpha/beta hydrolase [Enterococcus sp. 22-H-5-01]|uniref:alpha/beta hydrolase n=1 Tax=Enterococcus sp. 22-H-5-01 TaxID=3418555 RepID=UPI003D0601DB